MDFVDRLVRTQDADYAEHTTDGRVLVHFSCSGATPGSIAGALETDFEVEHLEEEEMFDNTGEAVDVETVTRVDVSAERRAILRSVAHWQAGFFGTLTLFPDPASFESALAVLRAELEEAELADG